MRLIFKRNTPQLAAAGIKGMRIQFRLRSAWPGSNFMRQRLGCPAACGVGALPPFHCADRIAMGHCIQPSHYPSFLPRGGMSHSRETAVYFGFNDIDFIDKVANICHSLSWALDAQVHKAEKFK